MIRKFAPALAVALVLTSASLASAASNKSQVRQPARQPSVMLLEDGGYARGSAAVNRNAIEENYIDKQNVWR